MLMLYGLQWENWLVGMPSPVSIDIGFNKIKSREKNKCTHYFFFFFCLWQTEEVFWVSWCLWDQWVTASEGRVMPEEPSQTVFTDALLTPPFIPGIEAIRSERMLQAENWGGSKTWDWQEIATHLLEAETDHPLTVAYNLPLHLLSPLSCPVCENMRDAERGRFRQPLIH